MPVIELWLYFTHSAHVQRSRYACVLGWGKDFCPRDFSVSENGSAHLREEPKVVGHWTLYFEELYKVDPSSTYMNATIRSALVAEQQISSVLPSEDEVPQSDERR